MSSADPCCENKMPGCVWRAALLGLQLSDSRSTSEDSGSALLFMCGAVRQPELLCSGGACSGSPAAAASFKVTDLWMWSEAAAQHRSNPPGNQPANRSSAYCPSETLFAALLNKMF